MGEIGDYELIVVDDASTDATGRLADEAAERRPPGASSSTTRRTASSAGRSRPASPTATGDLVLYTDADLPFDMDELIKACRVMRHYEADIVSAYRLDRTGEGYVRIVYSTLYNLLVRVLFGVRIRDINFAFKLCRREVLESIDPGQRGLVHRRRAGRPGPEAGLPHRPVRRRLLPADPGRVDPELAVGDRQAPAGDVRPPAGAAGHPARAPGPDRRAAAGRPPGSDRCGRNGPRREAAASGARLLRGRPGAPLVP